MASTVICPNCRRPQEESGRLTCADCSAILPSNPPPVAASASAASVARQSGGGSSALDDFAIPVRPTGAMTLLRNDLRSEDKNRKETGWLDNIIPRKTKDPIELEAAPKPRPVREPATPAEPARDDSLDSRMKSLATVTPPAARVPAASTPRVERPAPTPLAAAPSTGLDSESDAKTQVSLLAVIYGVTFALLVAIAILKGKDRWLDGLVLVTLGILAASLLGIWQRDGAKKAFWQGFAVFGLGYAFLAFVPNEVGLDLPTSGLSRFVHAKIAGTPVESRSSFAIMKTGPSDGDSKPTFDEQPGTPKEPATQTASLFSLGDVRQFTVAGHCFFTLVFALIGSALSQWFFKSRLAD